MTLRTMTALLFLLSVAGLVFADRLSLIVLEGYLAASMVTFIAYACDKSAARKRHWRTPENTLHMLALIGGWPGALVAQNRLRHKSSKTSFQAVFWATVMINCGALGWWLR